MSKFSLFIVMILVIDLVQAISISEVNYNPQGDDNNKEYIEIYSQEAINLSNYTIEDLSSLDVLTLVKSSNSSYYLVVEENFDHTQIDATIYTVGPTIGNNLNNDNDQITLKDSNGSIIETFTYTSEIGANNNNKSLCKFPESTGNWQECIQTPGLVNQIEIINIENNTQNSTIGNNNTIIENNSGQTNNLNPTIIINEIMPNPIGDDSLLPGGEWIELYNKGQKIDINGLILRDSSGKTIEINKDSTLGSTIINEYLIVYTGSKSSFLNNKDEAIIELLSNEKVIDFISYTNAKEGLSFSRLENSLILTDPTPGEKNNKEFEKNLESSETQNNSSIKIVDSFEEKDLIMVSLEIYKGDTNKEVIEIFASLDEKRIGPISKIKIKEKDTKYTITIPIIINTKSSENIKIIAMGLDTEDNINMQVKELELKSENYDNITKGEKLSLQNSDFPSKEINSQKSLNYESKKLKSKEYAIYLLIVAVFISVILIMRKK